MYTLEELKQEIVKQERVVEYAKNAIEKIGEQRLRKLF